MGADHVIKVDTKDSQKLADQIKDAMGMAPDIAIECTGVESSVAMAIYVSMCDLIVFLMCCCQATRSGGVVVLVGLGAPMATVPIVNASVREVDIRGIFRYCNWSVINAIVL